MLHGGGFDAINELYNDHNMEFWLVDSARVPSPTSDPRCGRLQGLEVPLTSGYGHQGFYNYASPIVMDFNEIFTALETGIIDGVDAANLTNNVGLGRMTSPTTSASTPCPPTIWPAARTSGMPCRTTTSAS